MKERKTFRILDRKLKNVVSINIGALDCVKKIWQYVQDQKFRFGHVNFEIFIKRHGEMLMRYPLIS